jgi:hypothetical protein
VESDRLCVGLLVEVFLPRSFAIPQGQLEASCTMHAKNPKESLFRILHVDQLNALTAAQVQEMFAVGHILDQGLPD